MEIGRPVEIALTLLTRCDLKTRLLQAPAGESRAFRVAVTAFSTHVWYVEALVVGRRLWIAWPGEPAEEAAPITGTMAGPEDLIEAVADAVLFRRRLLT